LIAPEEKDALIAPEEKDVLIAQSMDSVTLDSHIAVVNGRRWCIGRIVKEVDYMYDVTYITPSGAKPKCGRPDQGLVDKEDIILHVGIPQAVGSGALPDITVRETQLFGPNVTT